MKNIWEKYKEFWLVVIFLLFLVGIFYFIFRPLNSRVVEKRVYAEQKKVEREIIESKVEHLSEFKQDSDLIESQENFSTVFFQPDQAVVLIEKIEALANETNNEIEIKIVSENSSDLNKDSKSKKVDQSDFEKNFFQADFLTMQINLQGNFINIMKFIGRIENIDYFSDLVSLKISSQEDEKSGNNRATTSSSIFNSVSDMISQNLADENKDVESEGSENLDENTKSEGLIVGALLEIRFYLEK